MKIRLWSPGLALIFVSSCASLPSTRVDRAPAQAPHPLFDSDARVEFRLEAPLAEMIKQAALGLPPEETEFPAHPALLKVKTAGGIMPLRAWVRIQNHPSFKDCEVKKLEVQLTEPAENVALTVFQGVTRFRIGTHCGDSKPGRYEVTPYGRLKSEIAPSQQVAIHRLMKLLNLPTVGAGYARIEYVDTKKKTAIKRDALILEDPDAAAGRLGYTRVLPPETPEEAAKNPFDWNQMPIDEIAMNYFFQAMIANSNHRYPILSLTGELPPNAGPDFATEPLRNYWLFQKGPGARLELVAHDFDLAGVATGPAPAWSKELRANFQAIVKTMPTSTTDYALRAWVHLQPIRVLIPKAKRTQFASAFRGRKIELIQWVTKAPLSKAGREWFKRSIEGFYTALEYFEKSSITLRGTSISASEDDKANDRCYVPRGVPQGTSVTVVKKGAKRTEVTYFDTYGRLVDSDSYQPCPNPGWVDLTGTQIGTSID